MILIGPDLSCERHLSRDGLVSRTTKLYHAISPSQRDRRLSRERIGPRATRLYRAISPSRVLGASRVIALAIVRDKTLSRDKPLSHDRRLSRDRILSYGGPCSRVINRRFAHISSGSNFETLGPGQIVFSANVCLEY